MEPQLLEAVATGNAALLQEVLGLQLTTSGEGDLSCLNGVTAEGSSVLHSAASCGYRELIKKVHEMDRSLIKARNKLLDTPLICAARVGHVDVVSYLMEHALPDGEDGYAMLKAWNSDGETAMHEAVRYGHAHVLKKLMEGRSRLSAVINGNGVSLLYLAVASNRADMVKVLMEGVQNGERSTPSYSGPDGQTALHAAVLVSKEIRESLQWEPEITRKVDHYGRTALHYATLAQTFDPVEFLLRKDSSLAYIPDNDGQFPMHIATIVGNVSAVHEFTKNCLSCDELLDNKRRNILHCAIEHGRVKVVWHICRNPKCSRMMNARDGNGNTPLHLAVKLGQAMIFSILMMDHRVSLDIMDTEGLTPLDVAFSKIHNSDYTFSSFINTSIITCLTLCEASGSPCHHARNVTDFWCSEEKKQSCSYASAWTIFYACAFVAACSLTVASTPPGGCIAEGKDAGKPATGGRAGCLVFMIANAMSFFLSTATILLIMFARLTRYRRLCLISSAALAFGAVLFMLITFATAVGLILYPKSKWDDYILIWLVSNLAFPICLWIGMQLWTSQHRWQDISQVVALVILVVYVIRASIIPVQSIVKSILPRRQEPCRWPECVIEGNVFTHPT